MPEPAEVTMGWSTQAAPQGLQGPGAPMAGEVLGLAGHAGPRSL